MVREDHRSRFSRPGARSSALPTTWTSPPRPGCPNSPPVDCEVFLFSPSPRYHQHLETPWQQHGRLAAPLRHRLLSSLSRPGQRPPHLRVAALGCSTTAAALGSSPASLPVRPN